MSASSRRYRPWDTLLISINHLIRVNDFKKNDHEKEINSPAKTLPENPLSPAEKKHSQGLVRVNCSGEVCAQALYLGQSLTAKENTLKEHMRQSAAEELNHLIWCQQRLAELDSHPSLLDPAWYMLSYCLGLIMGLMGDAVSLGFIAATEELVGEHLSTHLKKLPQNDQKSAAILTQMLEDELDHAQSALELGGAPFKTSTKHLMRTCSKLMTTSSYHI